MGDLADSGRPREVRAVATHAVADLVSSELVLTEVPRARFAAPPATIGDCRSNGFCDGPASCAMRSRCSLSTVPSSRPPEPFTEPVLRVLDAIHVAAAASLGPLDAFVTYDERQAATARLAGLAGLAGLRTTAPGS